MSSDIAIRVTNLSKCYEIYASPRDRLKQFVMPKINRAVAPIKQLVSTQSSPFTNYYKEFWALKDVSLEIKKGETVGIIGRNGSGKSTLLQMICGTLTPTGGIVETFGRVAALLELGSGFNPDFTGRENVYMNGAVLGLSQEEIDERFDDITAFADIGDFIDQAVKTYSSGMVIRLAFAVAINVDPQILIIDEALSVGDELFQRKCFSRIEKIKLSGATILFVSHSVVSIMQLCDKAILLDCGELVSNGEPKSIVENYQRILYSKTETRSELIEKYKNIVLSSEENKISKVSTVEIESEDFDPNLISTSIIEFESLGPEIGAPGIFSLDGKKVNNLIKGSKYKYCYNVVFKQSSENVRFGMLIKTKSGMSLGSALSAPTLAEAIPYVSEGKEYKVEFIFACYLNPDVYFMNAGVFGMYNNEETVLHRKADVIAFRVKPVISNIATGIIDFDFEVKLYES